MGTTFLWIAFNLFVLASVALDLGVFSRRLHKVELREAALSSLAWVVLSVLFGIGVFYYSGRQPGVEFFTGYLIEKALSVDNLFLFLVIFRTFAVEEKLQHRMLEWGILGALAMRGIMIAAGAALIERFSWMLYGLGAFLVYAGIHMLFSKKEKIHPEQSPIFRFASRHLRVTKNYHGERFFVRIAGKRYATPLLLALLVVEITDVTLAVDSIPAVFGITRDPFIVYTSNVFAILGLRAMYFLLAGILNRLRFLTIGLSFVLMFIGGKMICEPWVHVSSPMSLATVGSILLLALIASLLFPARLEANDQPSSNITSST
jgi:tellurite resistance protein TerC